MTRVDIYPRVLPSAYCVLLAGPLPLQGALNHWGRILPQGPTIQNNQLKKRVCVKILDFDHFRDVLDFDLWPHPLAWTLGSDVME